MIRRRLSTSRVERTARRLTLHSQASYSVTGATVSRQSAGVPISSLEWTKRVPDIEGLWNDARKKVICAALEVAIQSVSIQIVRVMQKARRRYVRGRPASYHGALRWQ